MRFKDFIDEDLLDYIVVTISADDATVERLELIQEGAWTPSEINGWSLRLDPQRPEMKQQRHVHVAKSKYINSKTNQFSWNQDGTRHDRKTFCKSKNGIETAKRIAGDALGVYSAIFESASVANRILLLTESVRVGTPTLPEHTVYLKLDDKDIKSH
jgi:uncharacterized protein DUF6367